MAHRLRFRTASLGGYVLVASFFIFDILGFFAHAGRVLNLGYPLLATGLGYALYRSKRDVYVAFVWWMWLFTPEVRRLVDYQTSYHNISPVMLTPLLVTGIGVISVLRQPRILLRRSMIPFSLTTLVLVYGLIVGAILNGPFPSLYEFLNWVIPLGFGVFLMLDSRNFDANTRALMFAVILGLVVISLYGLYQFYHFPPWDAYWLKQAHFDSAGLGQAEVVRLFGTLNAPGPYAQALLVSLVFVIVAKGPLRVIAGGFGFPAFGLTLVRSAWGAWAIALIFIFYRIGGKAKLRLLMLAAIVAAIAVPLATVGPVSDALSKRFATFNNIQQDGSYQARQKLYETVTVEALSQPIGVGFGRFGLAAKLTSGQAGGYDSGLLETPYELGWVGTAIFVWSLGLITLRVLGRSSSTKDPITVAASGLLLANLSQNIFGAIFSSGLGGLTIWVPVALALGPMAVGGVANQAQWRSMALQKAEIA